MIPLAASTETFVVILIPVVVIWVLGLVDIFRRDLPWERKTGWILVVLLFPVVGTVTYFLLKKPSEAEIEQTAQARKVRTRYPRA